METRTINGKSINEVFQKLREDIPGVIKMTDEKKPKPYLDATVMRQFFDELIPVSNYDFTLTDVQFIQMGERACFVCTGTITVFDDAGRRIVVKSYTGSNNCIIPQETGQPKDLAMDAKNAAVSARKGCIAMFGCGERQLEQAKAQNKNRGKSQYGNSSTGPRTQAPAPQAAAPMQEQRQTAPASQRRQPQTGMGKFRLVYDKQQEIKNLPRMIMIPVMCRDYQNYRTTLLIWKDRHKDATSIAESLRTGNDFCCEGKFESYNNEYRIVLEKMEGRV